MDRMSLRISLSLEASEMFLSLMLEIIDPRYLKFSTSSSLRHWVGSLAQTKMCKGTFTFLCKEPISGKYFMYLLWQNTSEICSILIHTLLRASRFFRIIII